MLSRASWVSLLEVVTLRHHVIHGCWRVQGHTSVENIVHAVHKLCRCLDKVRVLQVLVEDASYFLLLLLLRKVALIQIWLSRRHVKMLVWNLMR